MHAGGWVATLKLRKLVMCVELRSKSSYVEKVLNDIQRNFPGLEYELEKEMYVPKVTPRHYKRYKVDIFIPLLNLAIEVDGEHHTEPVDYTGNTALAIGKLERRRMLDNKKNAIAEMLGWNMVRLSVEDVETGAVVKIISDALNDMSSQLEAMQS